MPVAGFYCQLFFGLCFAHALLDSMVDTRSIGDDQRRARISLRFRDSLYGLVEISTHSDLSNIYITIAHSNGSKIFLFHFLAACSELGDCTRRCSLGGLAAGIGVNFCVKYHDVDVPAACQRMVNAAESDIVGPPVTGISSTGSPFS